MLPAKLKNLICAVAQNDRAAFKELYCATSGKLFAVAIRIIKRRDLAEEILQDCYLKIWDRAAEYSADNNSPMSWMVSIVRNRAIDVLRKHGEVGLSDAEAENASSFIDESPDPCSLAEQSNDLKSLLLCMEDLDTEHRSCFLLAYYYGFTHEEIAERICTPVGTVKSRIRRTLARIRECMSYGE